MVEIEYQTKLCKTCGRTLPVSDFCVVKGKVKYQCKECKSAYMKTYRANNKERTLENGRRWHQENKEHHILTSKLWKERNKERSLSKAREWKANNKERVKEIWDEWYEKNREYAIARANERRLLEISAIGNFTNTDIKRLLFAQECKCVYCGVDLDSGFHADHIYPLMNYKYNGPENIQLLCQFHNLSKGAKDPIEYEELIGVLDEDRKVFLVDLREHILSRTNSDVNIHSQFGNALMPVGDVGNQGAGSNDKKPGAKPGGTKPVNGEKPKAKPAA